MGNHNIDVSGTLRKIRLDSNANVIDEIIPDSNLKNFEAAAAKQEGCQLKGSISVVKVPGNFHIGYHA